MNEEAKIIVEDIFSASKDGIKRICIVNSFCMEMKIDVKNTLILILFGMLMPNFGHALNLDETVDDEIF